MQIAFPLFEGFTALDAIGPYTVLARLRGAEAIFVAEQRGPVRDDLALTAQADASFDEVTRPDIILVPGGLVTRRMARDGHPAIDWIRQVHPTTTWTTSVCTGAVLLAAAGVLEGLEATTHWVAYDQLNALGARPTAERVVVSGKVVTGAGVSAGIDMALTLAGIIAGPEVAQATQLVIEYDPQPPYDSGSPAKAPAALFADVSSRMREAEERTLA
ncbi:MAG: DJ-1/PfpI family protein [Acidimicrobiia bacterium]|nr:DJ-1/PfpI family protein [Acidimicrobiia bacterium]